MRRFTSACTLTALATCLVVGVRAEENKDPQAVLDKAIKAMGGQEKLSAVKAFTQKGKGKIYIMGNESEFTNEATAQGLNHFRGEFDGEFGGNKLHGVRVLNGEKGWQKFGEMGGELDGDRLANHKRVIYLEIVPITIVPLRSKDFKVAAGPEEKVEDKPAVGLKITGPDGKEFQIYFDKETGLPVKEVAKVIGIGGEEVTQETTLQDFKDFGGIKRATKITIKHDGEKFMEQEITEFKVLDKVDPKKFDEPK
jgi:hypothetical protein